MILNRYLIVSLWLFAVAVYAEQNPIGWKRSKFMPSHTLQNETYIEVYHFVSHLPFTMTSPLFITKIKTSNEFSFKDNCSGTKLAAGETCSVVVTFLPTSQGFKKFKLALQYDRSIVPLPDVDTFTADTYAPISRAIQSFIIKKLPRHVTIGRSYRFEFAYRNAGNTPVVPRYVLISGFTPSEDKCSKKTLVPKTSCKISGKFKAQNIGTFSFSTLYFYHDAKGTHSKPLTMSTNVKKSVRNIT